ncbi:MAG: nucleotidyltransferase domain-containing protein [Deferribacteraceae bacterium]|jgi:predicted nucleotidyltransferase|nr:nucleotidyltransferase domain-containing protein [Deferribacteraceae bacterium]
MSQIYSADEIKEKLEPIFRNAPVERAILFGSYAKGLQTSTSDVDIVIDSAGKLLNINFYGVLEEIRECLDKQVDLIEIAEIHENSPIYSAIAKEGVILYERER